MRHVYIAAAAAAAITSAAFRFSTILSLVTDIAGLFLENTI